MPFVTAIVFLARLIYQASKPIKAMKKRKQCFVDLALPYRVQMRFKMV